MYLRSKLDDTPAFEGAQDESSEKKQKTTLKEQIKSMSKVWPSMLICMGLVIAWNVTNYMLTSFMPSYFNLVEDIQGDSVDPTTSQVMQIIVLAFCLALIPVFGKLSDKWGRRAVVRCGAVALIVLSIPSILLMRGNNDLVVLLGLLIMGLSLITFSATMPSTLPSLFPTAVRAGALSIAFNVSVSLFGGTTSTVMESLIAWNHDLMWPAYYLIGAGVVGLIAIQFTPESNGRPLWGSKPAAYTKQEANEHVADLNAEYEELKAQQEDGGTKEKSTS